MPFGVPNYLDPSDEINRLRKFQQMMSGQTLRELRMMGGTEDSLVARGARWLGASNQRVASINRFFGVGVTPESMTRSEYQRRVGSAIERRRDYYRHLYRTDAQGRIGNLTQVGRDIAGVFGTGAQNAYDQLIGRSDLQMRQRLQAATQLAPLMEIQAQQQGFGGLRSVRGLDASMRMARMLQDSKYLGRHAQLRPGEERQFQRLQERFTPGERAQFFGRMMATGEFRGMGDDREIDPATGRRIGSAEGAFQRTQARQATRTQRALANVARIQKTMEFETFEEAEAFAQTLKGGGRISDINEQTNFRLQQIKKRLGISGKAIQSILQMGNEIAQQIGITQIGGQQMAIQNVMDVRQLQMGGPQAAISQAAMRGMGGEQAVMGQMMRFRAGRRGTLQGQMERAAFAAIERIRTREGDAAATQAERRFAQGMRRRGGFADRGEIAELMRRAGMTFHGEEITAQELDIQLQDPTMKALIDEQTVGKNVEMRSLARFASEMKRTNPGKSLADLTRIIKTDRRFRDVPQGMVTAALRDPTRFMKNIEESGKGSARDEAVAEVARLNKEFSDPENKLAAFRKKFKTAELSDLQRKYLESALERGEVKSIEELSMQLSKQEVGKGDYGRATFLSKLGYVAGGFAFGYGQWSDDPAVQKADRQRRQEQDKQSQENERYQARLRNLSRRARSEIEEFEKFPEAASLSAETLEEMRVQGVKLRGRGAGGSTPVGQRENLQFLERYQRSMDKNTVMSLGKLDEQTKVMQGVKDSVDKLAMAFREGNFKG